MSARGALRRPGVLPPPLRLVAKTQPERDLHEAVAKALRFLVLRPAFWTCFPAGSVPLPARYATKLYRLGLQRGVPDVLLWYDGDSFGIELKRAGATLSRTYTRRTASGALREYAGQADVFPLLEEAGMRIAVCHDVDSVIDQLQAWSIPMRTHA